MDSTTPILVTGGTGLLGSYLLRYLVQNGFTQIRALRRPSSRMDMVEPIIDQIDWVEGDLLDIPALERAMEGIEALFNCAAIISFDPRSRQQMMRVNSEGTANIVNVALEMGVRRVVHASSIAAIGRPKTGMTISETTPWQRSKYNSNYAISKYLGEQEIWRGWAEGLEVGVVNPGVILGGGRWDEGPLKIFKLVWKNFPFYPVGNSCFVDVRDVARFMILLMESGLNGERFILGSSNMPIKNVMFQIADHCAKKRPFIKVTSLIQQIAWRIEWIRARLFGASPLITRETASHAGRSFYYDNQKSIDTFGFEYISVEDTISETASLFREAATTDFQARLLSLD